MQRPMSFYQETRSSSQENSSAQDPTRDLRSTLIELIAAGLVEAFFDQEGTVRFKPTEENFR